METEIKYRLRSKTEVDDILDNELISDHTMPDSRATKHLRNTYFDTPLGDLDSEKAIYRIREDDDQYIATVIISKSVSDGLHQRQEWSVIQDDNKPDIIYFLRQAESDGGPDTALTDLLVSLKDDELEEVCSVEFDRTTVHVGYGDTLIELACDIGYYKSGRLEEEFFEIELELLEGNVIDLREFGDELEKVLDIEPENMSKYEKSIRLKRSGIK